MVQGRFAKIREIHMLLLSLIVLSALSYFLVFSSKLAEVRRLQEEVRAANADMEASLSAWEEMSHTSRSDIDILEKRVAEWRSKVPESPETESLLTELGRHAARHGLRNFRLSIPAEGPSAAGSSVAGPSVVSAPQKEEAGDGSGEIRLLLSFFSTYRDMAEFLDGIPKMRRILSVNGLKIREKDGEMETDVELSAFYRRHVAR
jgi:Tfp pilus assembly protein PilO